MELYREDGSLLDPDSRYGVVVQVFVGEDNVVPSLQTGDGDHKAVVLAGDLSQSTLQIQYRMVDPPMPVVHLFCLQSLRQAEQLMPKANTKYRKA